MKRKYGSRFDWKRVIKRRYSELSIEDELFKGTVTLLHLVQVTESLTVAYGSTSIRIVDDGYYWMQHFPDQGHFTVTTMMDREGQVIQWYIDICKEIGYSEEKGPWMDDWILDLVVLPDGQMIELDVDEYLEARKHQLLPLEELDRAWAEFNRLKEEIQSRPFNLLDQTYRHFQESKKALSPLLLFNTSQS